ncbi:hypothetical protein LTR08_008749 [Meristemomyces frigidus]|nr:hypothetical protein LTR08_008749 [Meristemomyces frigidus]
MEASTTPLRLRPSRLPVSRSKSSHIYVKPVEAPVEPPKPALGTPKLQKRSSYQVLPRATPNGLRDASATANTASTRAAAPNGTRPATRPPFSARSSSVRPTSRGNQQRIPPPLSTKPPKAEDGENHDQLGSLDGFRAASRQGFYDDASPVEYQEPPEPDEELFRPKDRTKSRPSLSDRTIESLQHLPSTPSDRRRSSFFSPLESPMGPPPRPTSALSRNGSGHSRPGTSDGMFGKSTTRWPASPAKKDPASVKPALRTPVVLPSASAKRRSVTTSFAKSLQLGGIIPPTARTPSPSKRLQLSAVPAVTRSPSPSKRTQLASLAMGESSRKPLTGSKTLSARPIKSRPALGDAFVSRTDSKAPIQPSGTLNVKPAASKRVVSNPNNSSSALLRQQIAAAKAAARTQKPKHDSPQQADQTAAFGAFESSADAHDPFNQGPKDGKHILRNRIKSAWTDGKLNIAAMELKHFPDEVLHMYNASAMEEGKVNWAEVVDLTKLIAADNELDVLDEDIFPDRSADELAAEEEGQGSQFGGLETLDLHNNLLRTLPMGLRRLERLTTLNLSNNRLENGCLEIVAQMPSLRDLRLGHNALSCSLPAAICQLPRLETLDVQSNRLLGLPEALRELVSLKVLNVSGNQLTAIPMEALEQLPLLELDAGNNALIGSLYPLGGTGVGGHATLRVLRVANNSLAALTFAEALHLPKLRTLDVSNNHFTALPTVGAWPDLTTLLAADNKMAAFPAGFTSLAMLRHVDFTSNELRVLDPEVARMAALETLVLAANPLRERKYLSMRAAEIRKYLRAKLGPESGGEDGEGDGDGDGGEVGDVGAGAGNNANGTADSAWTLKPQGSLDLSAQGLSDDTINDRLGAFLSSHEVRHLVLRANKLTAVPPALWLGQDLRILDLSGNVLGGDYFSDELSLPALRELSLRECRVTTLEPLTTQLVAPGLQVLDVGKNSLAGAVPSLRTTYPALVTLLAADNKFTRVDAAALRGLQTVTLTGNHLAQLPAEIGLLWEDGLRSLEVGGNVFRVPGYRVLEKGTESTLRWLRGRLPAAEGEGRVEEVE